VVARESLRDRLITLVDMPDAYVVMPGGLGTLTELVFASESMRAGDISHRPIVCYGQFWRPLVQITAESGYMHHNAWGPLHFGDTPEQVLELITTHAPL
jgi:predicted Rossmann-fold nucleotide-binding protein